MKEKNRDDNIESFTSLSLEFTYHTLSSKNRQALQERIVELLDDDNNVQFAFLHGSFIQERPFRDIDLALFVQNENKEDIYYYVVDFASKLESMVKLPIDVQVLNQASLPFFYNVLTHGSLVFCRDADLFYQVQDITFRQYLDFQAFSSYTVHF